MEFAEIGDNIVDCNVENIMRNKLFVGSIMSYTDFYAQYAVMEPDNGFIQ